MDYTSSNVIDPKLQVKLRKYFNERFDLLIESLRKNEDITKFAKNDMDIENIKKLSANMLGIKKNMKLESRLYLQSLYKADIKNLKQIVDFELDDWK